MNSQTVLIVLSAVVLIITIAFVFLSVRKPTDKSQFSKSEADGKLLNDLMTNDFRSKKTKCSRCGGSAYGVLGTENVYRCSACGYRSVAEETSAPPH